MEFQSNDDIQNLNVKPLNISKVKYKEYGSSACAERLTDER